MLKSGDILLGTDGQAYKVSKHTGDEQGNLLVVGKDVCIPFSQKTLEVYERYGCPKGYKSSDKLTLIKGSEKKASTLWKKKEKALEKATDEIMNMVAV